MRGIFFVCGISVILADCAAAFSQGTAADYARAEKLPRTMRGSTTNLRLSPQWIDDCAKLLYRAERGDDRYEYMLVDTKTGERWPAFDHERLAKELSAAGGSQRDAQRLDFKTWTLDESKGTLEFDFRDRAWSCDLKTYRLENREKSAKRAADSQTNGRIIPERASRKTGEELELIVENRSGETVELFWIDPSGERRTYGKLKNDETVRRHTYAGHIWTIVDPLGKSRGTYEAGESRKIVIERTTRPTTPEFLADEDESNDSPTTKNADKSDRRYKIVVRDHNLYLIDRVAGVERRLTDDGKPEDGYVDRTQVSPNGKYVVALRRVPAQTHEVRIVESSPPDQVQPKLRTLDYLKPGDRVNVDQPHLFDLESGKEIPLDRTRFANPWSLDRLRWDRDSARFTFLYNERGHQALRLYAITAATGEIRTIIDETSNTFIDYSGKFFMHHTPEDEFIWMSERDGWNHLYLFDAATGQVKNPITTGEWVVRGVDTVDDEKRQVWFRAGGIHPDQDPYHVHFCRVDFDGKNLVVLTAGDGTHDLAYAPDKKTFVDTYSRIDLPPVHELRRSSDGKLLCELERADWTGLLEKGWTKPERFHALGRDGKTEIYGAIFRPSNFDSKRKYSIIEKIYAGPHGAFVPKKFSEWHGNLQSYAELGFIVVQIDGMGTSYRSKAFHDVCCKNLVDAGFPDRILWMRAAAVKEPAIDLTRVGIFGGSAGGQNALGALLTHGDFYKAAAADCGCHDNRMDKIWWNEQWMGWPIGPHYAAQSNVTLAKNLTGKLLLTVGELDDNVDPASTMQVVDALIKADKDFDLLIFPGAKHGAGESPYADRRRKDFFVRNLLGVEPRGTAAN